RYDAGATHARLCDRPSGPAVVPPPAGGSAAGGVRRRRERAARRETRGSGGAAARRPGRHRLDRRAGGDQRLHRAGRSAHDRADQRGVQPPRPGTAGLHRASADVHARVGAVLRVVRRPQGPHLPPARERRVERRRAADRRRRALDLAGADRPRRGLGQLVHEARDPRRGGVDAHTVRFHFNRAYAKQMADANEGVILPKHAWSQLPFAKWRESSDWFKQHGVFSGPFVIASWTPQQEVVLQRNERFYQKDRPYLDRVVMRITPDSGSALVQLLNGEVDFMPQVPPSDAPRIKADPHLDLRTYWSNLYVFIAWNNADPLFADRDVRRALTLGIDRQAIVD